ncbi:MAG: transglutaminase domain-containing protein [Planctomycetota bacterium]|nr:transglutaminase domain-containing protein [Planctomycetota bacterium]
MKSVWSSGLATGAMSGMFCRSPRRVMLAAGVSLACAMPVLAQSTQTTPPAKQPAKQPATQPATQPAKQPAKPSKPSKNPGALKEAVLPGLPPGTVVRAQMAKEPGPYIKLSNAEQWSVETFLNLSVDPTVRDTTTGVPAEPLAASTDFDALSFYFPIVGQTGNAKFIKAERTRMNLAGSELIDAQILNDQMEAHNSKPEFTIVKEVRPGVPLPANAWLTRWTFGEHGNVGGPDFSIKWTIECAATELDWENAAKVNWPANGWPLQAAAALQSQLYVDYGMDAKTGEPAPYDFTALRKFIDNVTKGKPKSVPPIVLARVLAAEIIPKFTFRGEMTQVVGNRGSTDRFRFQRVDETMRSMSGTELDLSMLLTAVYRQAGIPARFVIGIQPRDAKSRRDNKLKNAMSVWVEFCLYDEPKNTVTWVPVFPKRMREESSSVPALGKPWEFFGTSSEAWVMVPLAYQLSPAGVDAISTGQPLLWGWSVTPQPPMLRSGRLVVQVEEAPKTPGSPKPEAK